MAENLVIVESPAKAKTIERFLGKEFQVASSMGHIRDLAKKNLGIDITNNFKPEYIVPADKKKIVNELKTLVKKAKTVWLASDEDREGEAIAWHLSEVLKLDKENTRRIVFHEITKEAIQESIKNYRGIDQKLVNAQQARRILDRLVGFELSPILWRKVKPALSAGRVQSVAVRLIVEREREILNFKSKSSYKVTGVFTGNTNNKSFELKAEVPARFNTQQEAVRFLEKCINSSFTVKDIVKKPSKKSPSAPFTTSTLQQEASRKLGFSVSQTMTIAQRLYESGKITYMRTDSVNLSNQALTAAEQIITKEYGPAYTNRRNYKTKAKGAQEAHEAIRPAYLDKKMITGNSGEKKLYELIWKRTIASQMSDAQIEKTTVAISPSEAEEDFIALGEILTFDGFLKVYSEGTDEELEETAGGLIPPLKEGQSLERKEIIAQERFTRAAPRYTEASLVKKLEELGIGRPSTYAPTISTIQQRGYVIKEDRTGTERTFNYITLVNDKIAAHKKTEITGAEKAKLFPDNIGMVVNDFLVDYFKEILDYGFTATVEKEFDDIAEGQLTWSEMLQKFYNSFHKQVEKTLEKSEVNKGERVLGKDPKTGEPVIVRLGRYGALVQIGEKEKGKPRFASLRKGQNMESIALEEALDLFNLPRSVGEYENSELVVSIGRYGPYVRHNSKFYSLTKDDDPYKITRERAIEIIELKREREKNKYIKKFKEDESIAILNGRWGPYLVKGKTNYRLPKGTDAKELSYTDCLKIIEEAEAKKKKK